LQQKLIGSSDNGCVGAREGSGDGDGAGLGGIGGSGGEAGRGAGGGVRPSTLRVALLAQAGVAQVHGAGVVSGVGDVLLAGVPAGAHTGLLVHEVGADADGVVGVGALAVCVAGAGGWSHGGEERLRGNGRGAAAIFTIAAAMGAATMVTIAAAVASITMAVAVAVTIAVTSPRGPVRLGGRAAETGAMVSAFGTKELRSLHAGTFQITIADPPEFMLVDQVAVTLKV